MMTTPPKGTYHGVDNKETHLVAASVGYKYPGIGYKGKVFYVEYSSNNGKKGVSAPLQMNQNDTVSPLSNNKKRIPGENLVGLKSIPYNNYYLTYLLKKLSISVTIDGKIDYLQRIKEWIQSKRYEILSYNIRVEEIIDEIILHLAGKNENEEEAPTAQAAAEIITLIIGLEGRTNVPIPDGREGTIYSVGPAKRFLSNRHIEKIGSLIKEGIESFEPYLASKALGVILFMAAKSNVEANREKSLSLIGELANKLLSQKGAPHEEIKTQFLKQVEGAGAINIDQGKADSGIAKAIEEAQKSLIALQRSMRGSGSALMKVSDRSNNLLNQSPVINPVKVISDTELFEPDPNMSDKGTILEVTDGDITLHDKNKPGVAFNIKTNKDGIPDGVDIKSFKYEGRVFKVIETLEYGPESKPWNTGRHIPGSGQIGKYLVEVEGKKYRVTIRDYQTEKVGKFGGDWRIALVELKGVSSAMMEATAKGAPENAGGIDFRTMNYMVQPMGSFKDLRFGLPTLTSSVLERIDLDKELGALRNMVKAGMVPSGERVKEYLAACFQKGKIEEKQDDLLVCLAEIYRLAEEENLETSPELRESLVIVDTGKFVLLPSNQKVGLN